MIYNTHAQTLANSLALPCFPYYYYGWPGPVFCLPVGISLLFLLLLSQLLTESSPPGTCLLQWFYFSYLYHTYISQSNINLVKPLISSVLKYIHTFAKFTLTFQLVCTFNVVQYFFIFKIFKNVINSILYMKIFSI